ncbi:MAG: hypothetical protein Kow0037_12600 [Calditrichia bacterium]
MSQLKSFEHLVQSLPVEIWERHFQVGRLQQLEWLFREERKFTFLARLRVVGNLETKVVYLKQYKVAGRSEKEFLERMEMHYRTAKFWDGVFPKGSPHRVISVKYFDGEKGLFISEEAPGVPFNQLVNRCALRGQKRESVQKLLKAAENIGGWVREKNEKTLQEGELLSDEKVLDYVDVRLKILTGELFRGIPVDWRGKILRYLESKLKSVPVEERILTISHGDLNPSNILVDGDIVTAFDYARPVPDSYLLDLSKLYHQIGLWAVKPQYSPGVLQQTQQALLRGFGRPEIESFEIFQILFLLHTVNHFVTLTNFEKYSLPEKLYNKWVLRYERKLLEKKDGLVL